MTQHENDLKRKAVKDSIRPKVWAEMQQYCNGDGLIDGEVPVDLLRQARKLGLIKVFDMGRPDPDGRASWWFVRLHEGRNYKPPNYESYLQSS